MKIHRFIKEQAGWYIDLPEYLEKGGSKADLAMVAGADTMLDIMAGSRKSVILEIDTNPFFSSDHLELIEVCAPFQGGGYYILHTHKGKPVHHRMWLCDVTDFVFGYLPEHIYLRQID